MQKRRSLPPSLDLRCSVGTRGGHCLEQRPPRFHYVVVNGNPSRWIAAIDLPHAATSKQMGADFLDFREIT
jgi:hypothetical protein